MQRKRLKNGETSVGRICFVLALISVLTMIFATGLGPVSVAPGTTARILTSRIPIVGGLVEHSWEQLDENIIIGLRLPRVCL